MANAEHAITTVEEVRTIVGEENPVTRSKFFSGLEPTAIDFIAHSPFLLLATSDREGHPDVSPKGDGPGFVAVEDDHTLLIPERKGNKLIFTLQNILANPKVALIFFVPGTEETLRVHGTAELTRDPAVLERLTQREQAALLATRVRVDTCFFHCAKAFKRSHLWEPESWPEPRLRISFGKLMAAKLGGDDELAKSIDERVQQGYKSEL
jgi:uncharacterized protein